jgi:hypothetical protein
MNRETTTDVDARMTSTSPAAAANSAESTDQRPSQRLSQKYRFDDPDMDLFFVAALGWGPSGGLDDGEAHYVASKIVDGDGDSWVRAFDEYGDLMNLQADGWKKKGWRRASGEAEGVRELPFIVAVRCAGYGLRFAVRQAQVGVQIGDVRVRAASHVLRRTLREQDAPRHIPSEYRTRRASCTGYRRC